MAKAPDRPINPEAERAEVLRALASVDAVVIFDEDTPHAIISALQPDMLVKGADWGENAIVGRDVVEARGGRVVRIAARRGLLDDEHHRADPIRLKPAVEPTVGSVAVANRSRPHSMRTDRDSRLNS